MPSILKYNGFLAPQDSVKIPDLSLFEDSYDEEELLDDESGDSESEDLESQQLKSDDFKLAFIEDAEDIPPPIEEEIIEKSFTPEYMSRAELTEYYHKELEEIRRDAAIQGYEDAVLKKRGELAACVKTVELKLVEVQKLHDNFLEKYAQELKYLSIDIAEKIIMHKIQDDDKILKKLVLHTIASVRKSGWLDVEISEHLVSLVEDLRGELEQSTTHGRITVSPMACENGTCRVNAEEGTLVSSVSVQADNLRELFRDADMQNN